MEMYSDAQSVITESTNDTLIKTFFRMFLGLFATALISFFTYSTGAIAQVIEFYPVLAIAEIVLVLVFSFAFRKLSPTAVTILYFAYAILNGLTLSSIFIVYDIGTIFYAFSATTLLFGALALYGYVTKKDMTKFGNILLVGLIVGIVVSVINIFLHSSIIDIALNWVMLAIFCGLTIYDMQKIKNISEYGEHEREKLYVYCAMDLYLDFINIFLKILQLFARRRN